jgi:hypothetical protein
MVEPEPEPACDPLSKAELNTLHVFIMKQKLKCQDTKSAHSVQSISATPSQGVPQDRETGRRLGVDLSRP